MEKYIWFSLTQGMATLVDADNAYLFNNKWLCHFRGRKGGKQPVACRGLSIGDGKQKIIFLHRIIVNAPKDMVVDHINGDSLDNRRCNLRICTHRQNMMNQHKKTWKGVAHRRSRGSIKEHWQAYITIRDDGKKKFKSLGCFYDGPLSAAIAYNEAAKKYFGEYACLNDLSLSPSAYR